MTVPSSTSSVTYTTDGTSAIYPVPFRFLEASHILVTTRAGTGPEVVEVGTYTVAGAGNPSGGTVTFSPVKPAGITVVISRNVPLTQEADYVDNDPFPAESHEDALDKLTMIAQQLKEQSDRSLRLPITAGALSTELPAPLALNLIGWDSGPTGLRNFTPQEIATAVAFSNWRYDRFTATPGQTAFTLGADPGSLGNLDVSIDGVTQVPIDDYTVSGTTLTLTGAMTGGERVLARYGTAAGATDASVMTWLPAGTGAVQRTVQQKLREWPSLTDFGAVGDNVFDNAAAFAVAQANAAERIYLPEGTYYTSGAASLLTKHYFGPGKIRTAGGDRTPGRFTWMTSRPFEGTGSSYAKFFSADLSAVDAAYQVCSADRTSLTEPYFAPETSHQLKLFDNRAGYSGTTARLAAIAGAGATSATLNSSAGLVIGDTIGFNDGNDNITNIRTITNIVGNVISWSGGLTAPAPYAVGDRITLGRRTMQSMAHLELQHRGAGDGYIHLMRVEASYSGTAGQDHPFFRSTAGFDGGDIVASSPNVYLTGREITFEDNGNDIYVISEIRTFNRTNAAAALQQVWHGQTMNSSGSQWCEVAYIAAGKWKALFDSSRMDSSVNGGCVGNMANDQYFYWGSTGDGAQLYESWGRNRGTPRIGYSSGRAAFALDGAPITGDTLHVAPALAADPTIGVVASGVYTPTLFNTTNVAASSAVECQWMRVGRVVTVSGQVTIDPTAASVLTELGLSLPIASALVGARQVAGTACSEEAAGLFGRVRGDATNDRAVICFNVADIASRGWSFTFTYLVL